MAVQKGSEVLLGREDATYSGSYNIIGGQRSGDFEVTDETADFTHKTSSGLWQELMDGGTTRRLRASLGGVVIDDSDLDAIFAAVMGSGTRNQEYGLLLPGFGLLAATFHNPQFGASGEVDNPEGFTLQGQSAGNVTFVPGVTDRYGLQSALVLDFAKSSYWVGGAHTTTFAGISGATMSRTGAKTDAGGWDFSNGGAVADVNEFAANVVARREVKGALIEEASTNGVRNPRAEGGTVGVIGSGGALPTNWAASLASLTGEILSITDEEVEVQFSGTPSGTAVLYFEGSTTLPVTNGDPYTSALDVQLSAGDLTNVSIMRLGVYWHSAAGAYVSQSPGQEIKTLVDGTRRRFFEGGTVGSATYERARPALFFTGTGGGAVSFTLKIRHPQFEDSAVPGSIILPTVGVPAAASRDADDLTLPAPGSYLNSSAISVLAEFETGNAGVVSSRSNVFSLDDGSFDNILNMYLSTGRLVSFRGQTGGGADELAGVLSSFTVDAGQRITVAHSFVADDFYVAMNDSSVNETDSDSSCGIGMLAVATTLRVGADTAGRRLSGWLGCLRIAPLQFTDTEIEEQGFI